jgi:hypothetical protein
VASGSPSSLDAKRKRQAEKGFEDPLTSRERSPADLPPYSWSACQKKETEERERKKCKARVLLANFKFKFEFD